MGYKIGIPGFGVIAEIPDPNEPEIWKKCNRCSIDIYEGHPHEEKGEYWYCSDCAYLKGFWTKEDYLEIHGYRGERQKEVRVCIISKRPQIRLIYKKKTPKQQRKTKKYSVWRTKVFTRDNFTCQICLQRGNRLNAHHIKRFAKYPSLRYVISNGITLCEPCHKKEHFKGKQDVA